MARTALIRESDGYVENVIVADDDFPAPKGYKLITSDTAGPGDTWDGNDFLRPPVGEPDTHEPSLTDDELIELRALLA